MKKLALITLATVLVGAIASSPAISQEADPAPKDERFGVRVGIGTDLSGGIAYGFGLNYLIPAATNYAELGVVFFGGTFKETTEEGIHVYEETTDVVIIAMSANLLINYAPRSGNAYFIAGVGLGSISAEWEETSSTDGSLGTPLPGGGSKDSDDGSGGGFLFNLGVGKTFSSPLDLRLEIPIMISFAAPGEASSVIPLFSLTAGFRF